MSAAGLITTIALIICCISFFALSLKAKSQKMRVVSSVLLGLVFGFLAYRFVPEKNYDLVRHQDIARSMENIETVDGFFNKIKENDLEILPQAYSFTIAKIGDYSLMPAIIAFIGYGLLFYMLIDYKSRTEISSVQFALLTLVVIFGQHILFYFSGLYNYFAINLFAFAFYLDTIKKKKIAPYVVYALALLTHNSLILPIAVLAVLKIKKGKITTRFMIIVLLALLLFGVMVDTILDVLDIDFLNGIKSTFDGYIANNNKWFSLYDGFYLFMSITKIMIALLSCWICRHDDENKQDRAFTVLLATIVTVLSFYSIAITRFSSLVLFVSVPVLFSAMEKKGTASQLLNIIMVVLALSYTIYSLQTIIPMINLG